MAYRVNHSQGVKHFKADELDRAIHFLKTSIFTAKTAAEIKTHLLDNPNFCADYGFQYAEIKIVT